MVSPNIRRVRSGEIDVAVRSALYGTKENFLVGEGSEFHQLRDFSRGMDPRSIDWGDFEVDHLVALEIDGDNSVENLWPQSYHTEPLNAYRKDVLEHRLHYLVCHGELDLATAQQAIATDWVAAYKRYVLK